MTLNIYYDPSAPNNQRKVWTPGVSDGFVYGKDGGIGGSTGTWGADPNAPVVQVAAAVQQPIAHLQFSISPIGQPIPLAMGWCRLPGQVIWTDGIKSAPARSGSRRPS